MRLRNMYKILKTLRYGGKLLMPGAVSDLAALSEKGVKRLILEQAVEIMPEAIPMQPEFEKADRTTTPVKPLPFKRKGKK
jgi:hypothetical protein